MAHIMRFNELNSTGGYDPLRDGFIHGEYKGRQAIVISIDQANGTYTLLVGNYTDTLARRIAENPAFLKRYESNIETVSRGDWEREN